MRDTRLAAERAGVLDDEAARRSIDRSDMAGAIEGLPGQLRLAADRSGDLPVPDRAVDVREVIVLGMGGSAIGADLVAGAFADRLRVGLTVRRDPMLPAHVGRNTLVIASSFSGQTEETLTATQAALERGAPVVAITTGGRLADLSRERGFPLISFEASGQPRAAIGHGAGLVLGLLGRAGLLAEVEVAEELRLAAAAVDRGLSAWGPTVASAQNGVKGLAQLLHDRLAVVVANDHLAPVARRWKTQFNENAKVWAAWDELPEAAHNTVMGFGSPFWTGERVFVVALAGDGEPGRTVQRREAVLELLDSERTPFEVITLAAGSRLAQAFAGVVLGDLLSLYLALLRRVDPTPVDAIARLKARLS